MGQYMPGFTPPTKQRQPNYLRIILLLLLVAGLAFLLFIFFILFSVMNVHVEQMKAISMTGPNDGWILSHSTSMSPLSFSTSLYHYHDGQWSKSLFTSAGLLSDLDMGTADDGWAVSEDGVMAHYSNGKWAIASSPTVTNTSLESVAMVSANEGWASGRVSGLIHYQNGQWHSTTYTNVIANSIYMLSASEGWAVGTGIWHYKDGVWVKQQNPSGQQLKKVYMVSATDGWAVGGGDFSNPSCLILHYSGGEWQNVDCPASIPLLSVYMTSADEGWAVGGGYYRTEANSNSTKQSVLLHYKAGKWQSEQLPSNAELDDIAMVSANEGWAVGDGIWHYKDGAWSTVQP